HPLLKALPRPGDLSDHHLPTPSRAVSGLTSIGASVPLAHFNAHRALHQAAPLTPLPQPTSPPDLQLRRRDRLGGLIHEYAQVA
ncbi:MAG: hypothetical protein M3460_27520, partial [Actinomycetota bacterium]|nr:hypothetical protein [Actinomycetota bacterium]